MRSDHGGFESSSSREFKAGGRQEQPQDRQFRYNGNYFCSRSEAACAELMNKYLGYELVEGKTFQVPFGRSADGHERHLDFLVGGVAFEYHPFHPPKTPYYWKMLGRLAPGERDQFRDLWSRNDAVHYFDKRRTQLNYNRKFKTAELVVARSPEEFYEKIICRMIAEKNPGAYWKIPKAENFLSEFKEILGKVEELRPRYARHIHVRTQEERGFAVA